MQNQIFGLIHERTLHQSHYRLSVLNLNLFLLIFLGMTYHGDLYYEGKEFEIRLKEKKPGDLTDDLRTALGMPVGPNAHKVNFIIIYNLQKFDLPEKGSKKLLY